MVEAPASLWVWRHPRAQGADARCVGRTDLQVHPRRAKRLAHRVRQHARRRGLARCVITSPLHRSAEVGRWLRRWGWQHRIDAALLEMDFGAWDGRAWQDIGRAEVDAWCDDDFLHHRPGGGESLAQMLQRVAAWSAPPGACVVSHAGWMLARRWLASRRPPPLKAADWPAAPRHGECWLLPCELA